MATRIRHDWFRSLRQRWRAFLRDPDEWTRTETDLRAYAAALEEAALRAERSAEAKAEFLANMSHEIRTPMTAILGYVELMLEDEVDAAEREKYLTTVQTNGEHLLALINDILDLSKIEADRLEMAPTTVDVVEFTASIVELLRIRAKAKGLHLRVENDGPVDRSIHTDPTRLRQILVNLVGNAIKFTDEGEVRIRLRQPKDTEELSFDVVDTGIGISREQQERIFESFGQADSSTTRQFGGTGLGLTISKHLASRLGGSITVESELGRGSTFTVTLPVAPEPDSERIDDLRRAVDQFVPKRSLRVARDEIRMHGRVLVAEDNAVNQKLIQRLLQREGLDVTLSDDGKKALQCARAARETGEDFHMILMDMQMPGLNGYEATQSLRAEGFEVPIIALTANAMAGDRERCLEAGCDDYLAKPIDQDILRQFLRLHLEREPAGPRSVG